MVRHKNLVNFGQFLTTILCPIVVWSLSLHFNSRSRIFTRRNFRISRPIAGQLIFKDNFRACPNSISRSKKVRLQYPSKNIMLICLLFGIIWWSGRTQADGQIFGLVTCRARRGPFDLVRDQNNFVRPFIGLVIEPKDPTKKEVLWIKYDYT